MVRNAVCVVLYIIVINALLGTIYPMEVALHVGQTVILVLVIALVLHAHQDTVLIAQENVILIQVITELLSSL